MTSRFRTSEMVFRTLVRILAAETKPKRPIGFIWPKNEHAE